MDILKLKAHEDLKAELLTAYRLMDRDPPSPEKINKALRRIKTLAGPWREYYIDPDQRRSTPKPPEPNRLRTAKPKEPLR